MESYKEMNRRHQQEVNAFPMAFAFTEEQVRDGLRKLGLDPDTGRADVIGIGAGGFIRETDKQAYIDMMERHHKERQDAIAADPDGTGFIFQMFMCELADHEYSYTGDTEETLDALGITAEDLNASQPLRHGLRLACQYAARGYEEHPTEDEKQPFATTSEQLAEENTTTETDGPETRKYEPQAAVNIPITTWKVYEQTGYKPITTFYEDFSIADHFGPDAVRDTYRRSFAAWKDNYKYLTELVLALNWKIWEHYQEREDLARVYDELWHEADAWACDNLTGDELAYFYTVTD